MQMEARADEVRTAREMVAERLRVWGHAPLVEVARVLTSELVANAVAHGRPPITVEVRRQADAVRVEVSDCGEGDPTPRAVDVEQPGGLGLVLVASLATRWGVVADRAGSDGRGKTVWFELTPAPG